MRKSELLQSTERSFLKPILLFLGAMGLIFILQFFSGELKIFQEGKELNNDLKQTLAWKETFDLCEDQLEVLRNGEARKLDLGTFHIMDEQKGTVFSFADWEYTKHLPKNEIAALDYIHFSKDLPAAISGIWVDDDNISVQFDTFTPSIACIYYGQPKSSSPYILEEIRDGYWLWIFYNRNCGTDLGEREMWSIMAIAGALLLWDAVSLGLFFWGRVSKTEEPDVGTYEPAELFADDERRESSPKELELESMLKLRKCLPQKVFNLHDSTDDLVQYVPLCLMQDSETYPFLRRLNCIQVQFQFAYQLACQDILSSEAYPRTGFQTEKVRWRSNEFILAIKIIEQPAQQNYRIDAVFSVNADRRSLHD